MAGASFGKKAAELVREIVECDPETLPPYNADAMRTLSEQCRDHHGEMASLAHILGELQGEEAKDESEEAAAAREDRIGAARVGMLAHHQAILRNKRAMLVYLNERMQRVREMRWSIGMGLPESVSANMSHGERTFFTNYSKNLNEYMRAVDLDLTLDLEPPHAHKIQVRCLEDHGELYTRDGVVDLKKNTVHLLWREEAQPLIREGVLEQMDDH